MSQVEDALALSKTSVDLLKERYGKHQFKKKAKKEWIELYDHHLTNIEYLFTRDEVSNAFRNAVNEMEAFIKENEKLRKQ